MKVLIILSGVAVQRGTVAVLGLCKGDFALAHQFTLEVQARLRDSGQACVDFYGAGTGKNPWNVNVWGAPVDARSLSWEHIKHAAVTTVRALLMTAASFKKKALRSSVMGGIVLPAFMEGALLYDTVSENPPFPVNLVGTRISDVIFMGWLEAVMTAFYGVPVVLYGQILRPLHSTPCHQ